MKIARNRDYSFSIFGQERQTSVTEIRFGHDVPPTITDGIAPTGFLARHFMRDGRGGGVSVVHRNSLRVSPFQLTSVATTFERIGVKVTLGSQTWCIVGIYRPPPHPSCEVFDQFLIGEILAVSSAVLFAGDFNCRGSTPNSIDHRLVEIVDSLNFSICATAPTHITPAGEQGMLDLIIHNSDPGRWNDVNTIDTGIADHMFIGARLHFSNVSPKKISFQSRNLKRLDYNSFRAALKNSSFITSPVNDVDDFVDQMNNDVIAALDKFAPLHTTTKRVGKNHSWKLSDAAVKAKAFRRRCEKSYRKSKLESDRIKYRTACRETNRLIIQSQQEFFQNKLNESKADQRSTWQTANDILHRGSDGDVGNSDPEQSATLCSSFKDFFIDKIVKIRLNIASLLRGRGPFQHIFHAHPVDSVLSDLPPTSPDEVAKVIAGMKRKIRLLMLFLPRC